MTYDIPMNVCGGDMSLEFSFLYTKLKTKKRIHLNDTTSRRKIETHLKLNSSE